MRCLRKAEVDLHKANSHIIISSRFQNLKPANDRKIFITSNVV